MQCIRSELYSIYNTLSDCKFGHFCVVKIHTKPRSQQSVTSVECRRESRKEGLMTSRKARRTGVRQRNVLSPVVTDVAFEMLGSM